MNKKSTKNLNDAIAHTKNAKADFDPMKPCVKFIPPTGDLPEETADEIATCIENATAVVQAATPNVPNSSIFGKIGITLLNQPLILDVLEYAQEHPETIPTSISITEMATNIRRFNIAIWLFRLAENLLLALRRLFRIPAVRVFQSFRLYYQYVKVLAEQGNETAQVIYERLFPYFDRRGASRNRISTTSHKEDLEMDFDAAKALIDQGNARVAEIIRKEKELKRDISRNLEQVDKLVDEK